MSGPEAPTLFEQDAGQPAAELGPTSRVAMVVAYHGGAFHGFAVNAGVRTVGGALAEATAGVLGHPVELTVAGRTDKGVHAWGNVVTFDARSEGLDPHALRTSLNKMLRPSIAVRAVEVVDDDLDARFSATARVYRYTVLSRSVPDPFLADRAWHVDRPLDLAVLRLACDPFLGTHDFTSFCRRPKRTDGAEADLRRRIVAADWADLGDGQLRLQIEANAFCHQMVRSIVGFMVEVGLGRRSVGEIGAVLRGRDRSLAAGRLAPPHGLVLWQVRYDDHPHLPFLGGAP
ncbi:MAG: tRNA pseudouridine(38-40) synthase TruA [Acidimicrobiales bacterium]|nr:tRNA pseudouridine(38-40) synthase TruA [Acidimicrobiales bacterium]